MAFNRIVIKDGNGYTESFTKQVAAATLPGTLVKLDTNGKFAVAAAADDEQRLWILGDRDNAGDTVNTAYTADDTGVGYEIIPNRTVQIRAAVANYIEGDPVTNADSGYVQKATVAGSRVIGHIDRAQNITTAGDFVIVRLTQGSVVH